MPTPKGSMDNVNKVPGIQPLGMLVVIIQISYEWILLFSERGLGAMAYPFFIKPGAREALANDIAVFLPR